MDCFAEGRNKPRHHYVEICHLCFVYRPMQSDGNINSPFHRAAQIDIFMNLEFHSLAAIGYLRFQFQFQNSMSDAFHPYHASIHSLTPALAYVIFNLFGPFPSFSSSSLSLLLVPFLKLDVALILAELGGVA